MTISTALIEDIDKILPIRLEVHKYHYELDRIYQPLVDLQKSFATQMVSFINEKDCEVLVAEQENVILGYALGKLKPQHQLFNIPKTGLIDDIGVISGHRNKGIGEKLVGELIKRFKDNGAERISLSVHDKNKIGLDFWTRLGFNVFTKEMHKTV